MIVAAMCTALFLYDTHPALLLLLLFNRDEFYDRHVPSLFLHALLRLLDNH